jgi:hypothetical protein
MTYNEIQNGLLAFNNDQTTQAIREYYNNKSFLEILSKSRNESTHSAFLAWLLQGDRFNQKEDAPLMRFLDILINNSDGVDSEIKDDALKAAILSRTVEYTDVKTITEQTVKDISTIPSRDRLDIYLTASLTKPINGKKYLRIIIENKVFSEEIKADEKVNDKKLGMDNILANATFADKDAYLKLHQTQRYYSAVKEHPKDKDYSDNAFTLFVYLTPSGSRPTDNHFIPVSYQDLMDYVLEPLSGDKNLDENIKTYLQEYINALSVPSISDTDNELTVLAVSKSERAKLEVFWKNYEDIITAAANSNQNKKSNQPEDLVLQKFYEKNQPLFMAIYHIMPDKAAVLKPYSTRDYTKYTLKFGGQIIEIHLGKRAVVLAAAKTLLDNNLNMPKEDKYNRVFFYNEQTFEDLHTQGLISDDAYKNRYTKIDTNKGKFAICNQWGVGNWDWVEETLLNYSGKFELIIE